MQLSSLTNCRNKGSISKGLWEKIWRNNRLFNSLLLKELTLWLDASNPNIYLSIEYPWVCSHSLKSGDFSENIIKVFVNTTSNVIKHSGCVCLGQTKKLYLLNILYYKIPCAMQGTCGTKKQSFLLIDNFKAGWITFSFLFVLLASCKNVYK